MSAERYEPDEHAHGGPCMVPSEHGQWVALCDYTALESALRAVEAERDDYKHRLGVLSLSQVGLNEERATLRAVLDASDNAVERKLLAYQCQYAALRAYDATHPEMCKQDASRNRP